MKNFLKNYIVFLIFLVTPNYIFAQNCNTTNCENETNTNPNSTFTSPNSNDFKENTFNWMNPTFPINKVDYSNFAPFNPSFPLSNPFFSTANYLSYISGGPNSDNKPEDGWELIKQDFGYAYDPNLGIWNGNSISPYNKPIAYFILYNKYTAKLRILSTSPAQNGDYDKIIIKLELINPGSQQFFGKSNYDAYKANGIFAHTTNSASPLDRNTTKNTASAIANFPSSKQDFFFADFQLAYDPCICIFESGLSVEFLKINQASFNAKGLLLGPGSLPLASVLNGIGNIYGDNPSTEDFYAQFFNTGNTNNKYENKGMVQHYAEIEKLVAKINSLNSSSGGNTLNPEEFKTLLKFGALVASVNPKFLALKTSVEILSKYVDFATIMNNTSNKSAPSVSTSYLILDGTVNLTSLQNGADFLLAVPGSCGSNNRPEYGQADPNGVIPNYPVYNETPGLFALLKTPKIKRKFSNNTNYQMADNAFYRYQNGVLRFPSGSYRVVDDCKYTFKLKDGDFKYAMNPIVNESKTRIEAAIEVYGWDNTYPTTDQPSELYNRSSQNCSFLDFENDTITPRYRTEFFSISCIDDVIFNISFDALIDQDRYLNSLIKVRDQSIAYIVFNIYYVFKVDDYGKEHFTYQTVKYPLEFEDTDENLEENPNFGFLLNGTSGESQGNMFIGNTTYTTPQTIFSKGKITVNGNLQNTSGGIVKIISQTEIELINCIVDPTIIFEIGSLSDYFCGPYVHHPQQTTAQLNTYCNSGDYRAQYFKSGDNSNYSIQEDETKLIPEKSFDFVLYPNPTNDFVELKLNSNSIDFSDKKIEIILTDMQGKEIYRKIGVSEKRETVPMNKCLPGIYFISVIYNGEIVTNKVVKL